MNVVPVSALSWENIHLLLNITPGDILEITSSKGKEVEELAAFLDERFPGILSELANTYLTTVLDTLPKGSVGTYEEVIAYMAKLIETETRDDVIREKTAKQFENVVNRASTEYSRRAMIAIIEFCLGNDILSLREAGFAQCNFEDPDFDAKMQSNDPELVVTTLFNTERKKAEIFIQLLMKRRSQAGQA